MNRTASWIALSALILLGIAATVYQLTRPSPDGPERSSRDGRAAVRTDSGAPGTPPTNGAPTAPADAAKADGSTSQPTARAAHVDGLVHAQDGRPVAADVLAASMDGTAMPVSVTSGDDGRFTLELSPGKWLVRAESIGQISDPALLNVKEGDSAHLDLTLRTAATVVGQVTAPDGRPVEGASINCTTLRRAEEEDPQTEMTAYAGSTQGGVTDARGRYRLSVLPGTQSVQAERAGFGPAFGQVVARAGEEATCDLRLMKPLRISGRVVDKAGRAVEGASISATWSGATEGTFGSYYSRMATSSADGRYALEDLREGFHMLTASAKGYVTDIKYNQQAGSDGVDFTLTRGARIEGRVVRGSDGTGIESPKVICRLVSMTAWETNQVSVEKDGTFVVEGVGPGKHKIMARARGYAPGESAEFDVALEQTVTGVVVELTPGSTLRGLVQSARTRQPIEKATITRVEKVGIMDIDAETWFGNPDGECRTGADGRFVMVNVPPGDLRVRVKHDEYATLVRTITIKEGEEKEEEILLGDGARIHGRVLGAGDRPMAGMTVYAMPMNYSDQRYAQTDKDGTYEMKGLAAGTYMVVMYEMGEGAAGMKTNMKTVQLKEGESVQVDFGATEGVRLYGSVRQGGRVKPNVQLQFIGTSGGGAMLTAQTDATGNYEVKGAKPGEYTVAIDRTMAKCTVPSGQREVRQDFDLPSGTVSGHVYDEKTREKVAGAEVQAYRTGSAKGGMADFLERYAGGAQTDAEGAYEVSGLDPGEYVIQVTKDGYAAEMTAPLNVPANGNVGGVDLFLSGGAQIVGVVLDGRRQPVAGATFSLRDRRSGTPVSQTELWSTQSDEKGRFTLHGIHEGEFILGVHAQGFASWQQIVRISVGSDATVEAVLVNAGTLRVIVRDTLGSLVAGATLALFDLQGNAVESSIGVEDWFDPSRWKSGEDGRIERGGIAPGRYTGELTEGARTVRFEVDIVAGQVSEVAAQLK